MTCQNSVDPQHVHAAAFKMDSHQDHFKWIAQGTPLSVMCQPEWEGSLSENEYQYTVRPKIRAFVPRRKNCATQ